MVRVNRIPENFGMIRSFFGEEEQENNSLPFFSINNKSVPISLGDIFQVNKLLADGKGMVKVQDLFPEIVLPEGGKVVSVYDSGRPARIFLGNGGSFLGREYDRKTFLFIHPEGTKLRVLGTEDDKGFDMFSKEIGEAGDFEGEKELWATKFVKITNSETIDSVSYPKDSLLSFYKTGKVWRAYVPAKTTINNMEIPAGSKITFYDNGKLSAIQLGEKVMIGGIEFPKGVKIKFYKSGNPKAAEMDPDLKYRGEPFIMYKGEKYSGNDIGFDPYSKNMEIIGKYSPATCELPGTYSKNYINGKEVIFETKYYNWPENTVKLQKEYTFKDRTFSSGTFLEFDEEGRLRMAYDIFGEFDFISGKIQPVDTDVDIDLTATKTLDFNTSCIKVIVRFDENGNEIEK